MFFATLRLLHIFFFRALGSMFFYLFKKRRRIAISNIKKCQKFLENRIGDRVSPIKIVKKSFACLGQTLGDFLLLRKYTNKNIDKYVIAKNLNYLEEAVEKGNGVIISTAHFGSWELAAHYFALKGFKSLIIYNKFKKPVWFDDIVKRQRENSGNTLLLKDNSFLSLYKHLKKGGIIILLTDQHAFPPEGERVSFLGQDAWTHTAFVKMSKKTGAPIIPAFMFVEGISSYSIELCKPIYPEDFSVLDLTRACNIALEDAIVRAPHLWMWQHRRFKEL